MSGRRSSQWPVVLSGLRLEGRGTHHDPGDEERKPRDPGRDEEDHRKHPRLGDVDEPTFGGYDEEEHLDADD